MIFKIFAGWSLISKTKRSVMKSDKGDPMETLEHKKIVYVTSAYFPFGQAYSTRVIAFSKLLKHLGYSVHVIADFSLEQKRAGETEDCSYEIVGRDSSFSRWVVNANASYKRLKEYLERHDVAFVIMNGGKHGRFKNISKLCAERKIPLILEICEWFDKSSFKLNRFDPRYINMGRCMNKTFRSANGVIAISRFLESHFREIGIKTIRIPTILDTEAYKRSEMTWNNHIRLIFAGSIGHNKESFRNIMLALKSIDEKNLFDFYIYGGNRNQIFENIGKDESLFAAVDDIVNYIGKIPQAEIHDAYQSADYQIFIRPDRRSSHAGFPTKLAESMVAGTPVITNDTGDIGLYLKSGDNGYLLKDSSPESIKEALEKTLQLTGDEIIKMRKAARKMAEESFDYRIYAQPMQDFLEEVCR